LRAAPAGPARAFTVDSAVDPGVGACTASECTLRENIVAVNATADADGIFSNSAPLADAAAASG
jgi:CSLREA domain-containing protein